MEFIKISPSANQVAPSTEVRAVAEHKAPQISPASVLAAPIIVRPFIEPKPLLTPRNVRAFSASLGLGCVSVAAVYYFVSKSIGETFEEERLLAGRIHNRIVVHGATDKDTMGVRMPEFKAPSSYHSLEQKMRTSKEIKEAVIAHEPVLHNEAVKRMKLMWNDAIVRLQTVLEMTAMQLEQHKFEQSKRNIVARLEEDGYLIKELRQRFP